MLPANHNAFHLFFLYCFVTPSFEYAFFYLKYRFVLIVVGVVASICIDNTSLCYFFICMAEEAGRAAPRPPGDEQCCQRTATFCILLATIFFFFEMLIRSCSGRCVIFSICFGNTSCIKLTVVLFTVMLIQIVAPIPVDFISRKICITRPSALCTPHLYI